MLTGTLPSHEYFLASRSLKAQHEQTLSQKALRIAPAHSFTLEELTGAYNETRTDYIIPMPMTPARMQEYITLYDLDLEASCVVLDRESNKMLGLGMLGIRDKRSWITRLGVVSNVRGRKIGQALMEHLILESRKRYLTEVWLEVIKNNTPAHKLFEKMGFRVTRELLVGRRAPAPVAPRPNDNDWKATAASLTKETILKRLYKRPHQINWLIGAETFANIANLRGLNIIFANGARGWVIYQDDILQFKHVLTYVTKGPLQESTAALLRYLHRTYPIQDAMVENIAEDDMRWTGYDDAGYFESFRRIEMVKKL